jgi:hypothetical protein
MSAARAIDPARIGVRLLCIVDPPNASERLKTNSKGADRFPRPRGLAANPAGCRPNPTPTA